jgi:hypothetical protein
VGRPRCNRRWAAIATAESATNDCAAIHPFYWEIGRASGAVAAGSLGDEYAADTRMSIASASKWLYASYVMARRDGEPTAEDVEFLTFRSGYTSFGLCRQNQTVQSCLDAGSNGDYSSETHGYFSYGGGHMQKHAVVLGLGPMNNDALAAEVGSLLDVEMGYAQPQPAGGAVVSAAEYAKVLRRLLAGTTPMAGLLGSHAVCTNPDTCPEAALKTPIPPSETWHYSLGHWVEDDPLRGDGAFSSAGAFGFYPWIDADKTTYGVVARAGTAGNAAFASVKCGRLLRRAFLTGEAQPGAAP